MMDNDDDNDANKLIMMMLMYFDKNFVLKSGNKSKH